MSSTNQTTHYQLPLFIASDKPAWLTDWNTAMIKIDELIFNGIVPGDYQETLISGQNIKTIGGEDILGAGNINIKTINNESILGEGNVEVGTELISGENIKTINGIDITGSGNIPFKTINGEAVTGNGDIAISIPEQQFKTINGNSITGSGNITVQPTLVSGNNIKSVNNQTILGSGNLNITGNINSIVGNMQIILDETISGGSFWSAGEITIPANKRMLVIATQTSYASNTSSSVACLRTKLAGSSATVIRSPHKLTNEREGYSHIALIEEASETTVFLGIQNNGSSNATCTVANPVLVAIEV